MKTIAIAMQKGGVGKSTLTRSIAVAASKAGMNVLTLDMDAQQSTTQWADRRGDQLPLVRFVTEIELPKVLKQAAEAGCDLVIIDTPPARSTEAPAAVEYADLVLVPCTPDIEAYEQLPRTERLARTTGKPAAAVLTMAQPNSRSEEEIARAIFAELKLPMVPAILHRFKVHRDASRDGQTAQELEPDSKAAQEIQALWDWVCAELQIGTSALVHKKMRAKG
ncbi:AAA family ATPase [Ruixingdingia sedimenti]|uniref:AAA family ATPase n=1 Tax=Ruixingdingia sedimenti TaxID=3073604 RepID=A0ABU1FDW6_9RHOB|nr:AAA family ATPase [Xinfangfangia sp. LG-4]MDR5655099.1 AAA family ATPase [Xinfangfangia sp. LG-4]